MRILFKVIGLNLDSVSFGILSQKYQEAILNTTSQEPLGHLGIRFAGGIRLLFLT